VQKSHQWCPEAIAPLICPCGIYRLWSLEDELNHVTYFTHSQKYEFPRLIQVHVVGVLADGFSLTNLSLLMIIIWLYKSTSNSRKSIKPPLGRRVVLRTPHRLMVVVYFHPSWPACSQ
jgi:hypothetical protein